MKVEEPHGSSTFFEAHPMTKRSPRPEPTLPVRGPNPFLTFLRNLPLLLDVPRRREHERAWMERVMSRPSFGSPRLLPAAGLVARDAGRNEVLPDDLFWAALANAGTSSREELVLVSSEPSALRARIEQVRTMSARLGDREWFVSFSDDVARVLHEMRMKQPREDSLPAEVLRRLLHEPEGCTAALRLAGLTRTAVLDWAGRFSSPDA